jgi:hypothetical protein
MSYAIGALRNISHPATRTIILRSLQLKSRRDAYAGFGFVEARPEELADRLNQAA